MIYSHHRKPKVIFSGSVTRLLARNAVTIKKNREEYWFLLRKLKYLTLIAYRCTRRKKRTSETETINVVSAKTDNDNKL